MELLSFYWWNPKDIHLMRRRSAALDLIGELRVKFKADVSSPEDTANLAAFLHDHPDAQCTFKPIIKANPRCPYRDCLVSAHNLSTSCPSRAPAESQASR